MFLNTRDYPFTVALETSWKDVLAELKRLPPHAFMAWPEKQLYGSGWEVFALHAFGRKVRKNCDLCPKTTKIVEMIPGLTTAGFSWLKPGTHILPHTGYTTAVLRCHLGLVTPPDCALRVGPEVRAWQAGRCVVFDDTTEHEVWNRSDTDRIVLLVDFLKAGASFEPPGPLMSQLPSD